MKPAGKALLIGALVITALAVPALPARPWFIAHTLSTSFDPAVSPEMFQPAADGARPSPGNPALPVTMDILPLPPGWDPAIIGALTRSVLKWNGLPGTTMRTSAITPDAGAPYDPNWQSRYGVADGRNTIEFVTSGWGGVWTSNTIARNVLTLDPSGRIIESDIFINAQDFRWAVFPLEGSYPELESQSMQDVEAIITHECGHIFGIGHSQFPWTCMYATAGYANTLHRRLTTDDLAAARFVYPATAADVPPPSLWGAINGVSDGVCGQTYLTILSAPLVYSENLILSHPLGADLPFCLFGSGFTPTGLRTADLAVDGSTLNTVTGSTYVGPNFVKATVADGPLLPAGTYDFAAENNDGSAGFLPQGLTLNPAANNLPVAVVNAAAERTEPGRWVALDGSGSSDPDGTPLTYKWWVEDSPVGAAGTLSATDTATTSLYLPAPGMYVVRLVVSDGTVDSIADQALVRAEYSLRSSGGGGHDVSPFSCLGSIASSQPSPFDRGHLPACIIMLMPLAIGLLSRVLARNPK